MIWRSYQSRFKVGTSQSAMFWHFDVDPPMILVQDREARVNMSQGKVKLIRVNVDLELIEFPYSSKLIIIIWLGKRSPRKIGSSSS